MGPGSPQLPVVRLGHRSNGTEPLLGPGSPCFPLSVLERTQEQRNGTTPGSWQSSLSSFSFPLSRLGADTGATEGGLPGSRQWFRSVAPVSRLQDGQREAEGGLQGPGSPHSPPSASRCHVLERTQEQRGTTPGSWQSSLSASRCHVLELTQEQRNGITPGSWQSSLSASRCHVLERTQEQRNGTTPGSWQSSLSSFSFPLSPWSGHRSNGTEREGSWQSSFSFPLSRLGADQEQRNGITPGSVHSPPSASRVRSKT